MAETWQFSASLAELEFKQVEKTISELNTPFQTLSPQRQTERLTRNSSIPVHLALSSLEEGGNN